MDKHRFRESLVGLPDSFKMLICERRILMIKRWNVRDGKSGRAVVRNEVRGEIGVPLELVAREEANDRADAKRIHFANPVVHLRLWNKRPTFASVSGPSAARQSIFDHPVEYRCHR